MNLRSKLRGSNRHKQDEYDGKIVRAILIWYVGLIGTSIAVGVGYLWLDRPIALWVHHHSLRPHQGLIHWLAANIANPLIPVAAVTAVGLLLRAIVLRSMPRNYEAAALICSLSVLVTEALKRQLKFVFGRAWPETWVNNNPSFIRNGDYQFHFMHGGDVYQSFPSGHMATACAVIAVLWVLYPKWRWIYSAVVLIVGLGLVLLNLHFLSDVLAGAFVGISVGAATIAAWRRMQRFIRTRLS